MVDASIIQAVQDALRTPPPAIHGEAPIPREVEKFFEWQQARTDAFEQHSQEWVGAVRHSIDALADSLREPGCRVATDDLDAIVDAAGVGLALSLGTVETHREMRDRVIGMFRQSPFSARVRRAADRIAAISGRQHDALVDQYYRLVALRAERDPEAIEAEARATNRAGVSDYFASLRAS